MQCQEMDWQYNNGAPQRGSGEGRGQANKRGSGTTLIILNYANARNLSKKPCSKIDLIKKYL